MLYFHIFRLFRNQFFTPVISFNFSITYKWCTRACVIYIGLSSNPFRRVVLYTNHGVKRVFRGAKYLKIVETLRKYFLVFFLILKDAWCARGALNYAPEPMLTQNKHNLWLRFVDGQGSGKWKRNKEKREKGRKKVKEKEREKKRKGEKFVLRIRLSKWLNTVSRRSAKRERRANGTRRFFVP